MWKSLTNFFRGPASNTIDDKIAFHSIAKPRFGQGYSQFACIAAIL